MDKKHPDLDLEASCACGAVSIALHGKPVTMLLCSCRDCQKATGSGHATLAIVRAQDVTVSGLAKSFSLTANSGSTVQRHFCPNCGTPLYGTSDRFADLRLIPVGMFGDTPWFQPGALIFERSHNDWDTLPDIRRYQTYKDEENA